jgi:hypothetical protein
MIKNIIKYYSILIFLTITFLPNLSKHNEYINIFYSSPQYDISIILLLLSGLILQIFRWKYDSSYREWLKKRGDIIIFILFIATSLLSFYFAYQAINDYYFLKSINIK